MISPSIATIALAFFKLKFTNPIIVPVSDEQIPALTRPIIAIKRPIPTETAFFNQEGIDSMIFSRTPKMQPPQDKKCKRMIP